MEDFTRTALEEGLDILVTEGHLNREDADQLIADAEGDPDVTLLFDTVLEQARLEGYSQGYDDGYDAGVDSNTGWDEDEDDDE